MRLSPRHSEAVQAYLGRMKIKDIEKRFGVHDMQLYRILNSLGIERRGHPKSWCLWCGETLKSRRASFCCRSCQTAYQDDENGIDMMCLACGERRVKCVETEWCSDECKEIILARRLKEDLRTVGRYSADLLPEEISEVTGISAKRVRALQEMLPAKKFPGTLSHLLTPVYNLGAWRA